MSRTKPTCPSTEINDKRQIVKSKRGFGLKKLGCGNSDKVLLDQNAQSKDPLFRVRGIERFRRCNLMKITG